MGILYYLTLMILNNKQFFYRIFEIVEVKFVFSKIFEINQNF